MKSLEVGILAPACPSVSHRHYFRPARFVRLSGQTAFRIDLPALCHIRVPYIWHAAKQQTKKKKKEIKRFCIPFSPTALNETCTILFLFHQSPHRACVTPPWGLLQRLHSWLKMGENEDRTCLPLSVDLHFAKANPHFFDNSFILNTMCTHTHKKPHFFVLFYLQASSTNIF